MSCALIRPAVADLVVVKAPTQEVLGERGKAEALPDPGVDPHDNQFKPSEVRVLTALADDILGRPEIAS